MTSRNSVIALMMVLLAAPIVYGGEPEYMKLNYENVPAVEVKGYWDTSGFFVATDIEALPKDRRPKLRGEIQAINPKKQEITMYGIEIEIEEDTQFRQDGAENFAFDDLEVGQRVEVSCKIDADGEWEARKITVEGIKESDKIKGTITRTSVDGNPPDTLEIHGLRIILTKDTDVNEPTGFYNELEQSLFAGLASDDDDVQSEGFLWRDRVLLTADYRQTVFTENEYDLSETYPSDHFETEPELRFEMTGYWSENVRTFGQLRLRKRYFIESERDTPPPRSIDKNFFQLYLLARNVGARGLAFQIGRQDFDEPREWLFDEHLDAIRMYYYGTKPVVLEVALIHQVFDVKDKFKTWTDVFTQLRWFINRENFVRSYVISRTDTDTTRNREPVWWGLGYSGHIHDLVKPWFEISLMRGNDKGKNLNAYAFDIGATFRQESYAYIPSVTLAYALATGDATGADNIDHEFRQTGYEDNVDYLGGVTTVRYYGEVLDPELSNLKILTAGIGFRPLASGSLEVIYHSYRQEKADDGLRGNLVDPPARPNEISADIGWEVDFALGVSKIWEHVTVSWIYGIFKPGQAFAPFTKTAKLNRFNLKIDI